MGVELETKDAGPGAPADVLSFLIADVRGYTSFTRQRGDAEGARLATRFAALAADAVAARSGEVVEVRGDEVFAVFVSASQAVRAALELQATLAEESAADPSLPLPAGIGIATGKAVRVGDGFRGSALNLAARLCGRAAAGQVLVAAGVVEQIGDVDVGRLRELGQVALKGIDEPVSVYEAVAAVGRLESPPRSAAAQELPLELRSQTPLVGRQPELAWLRGTWRSARRGHGRIVFVSGPSGIGKTSLAAALAEHVAGQGYAVDYSGIGGIALAQVRDAVDRARSAHRPTLVVLDDLQAIGTIAGDALRSAAAAIAEAPALVVALIDDLQAAPDLEDVVLLANVRGDGHRRLLPLQPSQIAEVARGYAGDEIDDVPVESIVRRSGGVPAEVHELLDAWVREEAARRLEAAAEWLAAGQKQRAAQLEFANTAIERRLRRIYSPADVAHRSRDESPYKGLAPFGEDDAEWFFGRERLVGELAARTVATGLLAVVGPSGSGKSSLVRAGLLPSLAAGLLPGSRGWRPVTIRPGAHPKHELPSEALTHADPEHRLVLAVDQFEEVFTLCEDSSERDAFIDALVDVAASPERAVVILTIRGDFLDHVAEHHALAELVSANAVLVGPMAPDEYRRAVVQPAHRCGVRIESALAAALVDEAVGQPGALPLLSTALVELWGQVSGGWLRIDAYRETGGLRGAVARLAEASYQELDEPEQRAARRVFMRLAGSGEGDTVTRRRVSMSEFDTGRDTDAGAVLDRFVADRLLTRTDETVEVAHEALLREWPRLREWLAEDAQGRRLHHHLTEAAAQWRDNGRRSGDLYRAERLSAAAEWSSGRTAELNRLEHEFLNASQVANTRAVRRLRIGVAVLAALLLLSMAAGVIALSQRRTAQHAAAAARQQAQIAIGQRVGVQAASEPDMSLSLLLAVQAAAVAPSSATSSDLAQALVRSRSAVTVFHAGDRLLGVAVSPDGKLMAASGSNGGVWIYDTRTGHQLGAPIEPAQTGISGPSIAFSPDNRTLAIFGGGQGRALLNLVDARTHRRGAAIAPSGINSFRSVAFSPDRQLLVAVGDLKPGYGDKTARQQLMEWHLPDMRPVRTPRPIRERDTTVMFAPGGSLITVSDNDVGIWRARPVRQVTTYSRPAGDTALSPDGNTLAIMSHNQITLLDLRTGRQHPGPVPQPGAPTVDGAQYTADGTSLVGISGRDEVTEIDLRTGKLTTVGRGRQFISVAVAADGSGVYTAGLDQTAVRWGLDGGRFARSLTYSPPTGTATDLVVSSRDVAATVDPYDSSAQLWNLRTRTPIGSPMAQPGGVGWSAFSPDGRTLAMTSADTGQTLLWDVATHRITRRLTPPHPHPTDALAYSPNGRLVAAGTLTPINRITFKAGYVTVWNVTSGKVIDEFHQPGDQGVSTVVFSPDSRRVVSVGGAGTVALWDVARHSLIRSWKTTDDFTLEAAFDPDGSAISTGGVGGGLTSFWNPSTGRPLPPPLPGSNWVYPAGYYDRGAGLVVARHNHDCGCDAQAELWDVPSRGLIATLPVGGGFPGVVVTPNGREVVTTSTTGHLTIWPLTVHRWMADACLIANRTLTLREWHAYLPGLPYRPACNSTS
jgi:WD40 repeat protein/class 3 adenylate cyclase/energy-coupling factor transporter ATP-binding protein EcfA2